MIVEGGRAGRGSVGAVAAECAAAVAGTASGAGAVAAVGDATAEAAAAEALAWACASAAWLAEPFAEVTAVIGAAAGTNGASDFRALNQKYPAAPATAMTRPMLANITLLRGFAAPAVTNLEPRADAAGLDPGVAD